MPNYRCGGQYQTAGLQHVLGTVRRSTRGAIEGVGRVDVTGRQADGEIDAFQALQISVMVPPSSVARQAQGEAGGLAASHPRLGRGIRVHPDGVILRAHSTTTIVIIRSPSR